MAARTCAAQGIINRISITKIKCFYAFAKRKYPDSYRESFAKRPLLQMLGCPPALGKGAVICRFFNQHILSYINNLVLGKPNCFENLKIC